MRILRLRQVRLGPTGLVIAFAIAGVLVASGLSAVPDGTVRVTEAADGSQIVGNHGGGLVGANGAVVAFTTDAAFVTGDTNTRFDVYVKGMDSGVFERASVQPDGSQMAGGNSGLLDISPDGRFVLYQSRGSFPGVTTGLFHVYLRNRLVGTTERIDVSYDGVELSSGSFPDGVVSDDGRYVAFYSRSDLVPGMSTCTGTGGCRKLYFRDVQTGTTRLIGWDPAGHSVDAWPTDIAPDGRYVYFGSNDPLLADDELDGSTRNYRWDRDTEAVTRLCTNCDSSLATADGSLVFISWPAIFTIDTGTLEMEPVPIPVTSGPGPDLPVSLRSISHDGRFLLIASDATNLPEGPGVYVLDRESGAMRRLTGVQSSASISSEGDYASFDSNLQLAPSDTDTALDVYFTPVWTQGPIDLDHDGIEDSIDTGDGTFADGGTTAGTIGAIPAGYSVTVTDAVAPDGVRIRVSGSGTEKLTIVLSNPATGAPCGTVKLLPGSDVELTCGSITASVAADSPAVEIVLSDDTALLVGGSGVAETATVSISTDGSFVLDSISGGDGAATLVTSEGAVPLAPSATAIYLWDFAGFSQPVDNGGVFNVAKAGSSIPLKWRLVGEDGTPVTNLSAASVGIASVPCEAGATTDTIEETAPAGSSLQNKGNGYYQLNWKTPSTASGCKMMRLSLAGEGPLSHSALFKFK